MTELTTIALFIQFVALPFYLYSFLIDKKQLLLVQLFTTIIFACGYFIMSAWVGVIISLSLLPAIFLMRDFDYNNYEAHWPSLLFIGILMINVVGVILLYQDVFSLVVVIGGSSYCYAIIFYEENSTKFKSIALFAHTLFVVYEIIVTTYVFAIIDSLTSISLIMFILMQSKKRTDNERNHMQ